MFGEKWSYRIELLNRTDPARASAPMVPASELIWQQAIVSRDRQRSFAEISKRSACSRCLAGKGCGAGLFSLLFAGRNARIPIPDGDLYAPGQRIRIGVQPGQLMLASAVLYLFPLLCFMLGLAVSELWLGINELFSLLIAVLCSLAALHLVRRQNGSLNVLTIERIHPVNSETIIIDDRCGSTDQ